MTNISLQITQEMKERLDEEKKRSGVPISEIIRRAIQDYLTRKRENRNDTN